MPRYIDANNIRLTGLTFTDVNKNVYFSLSDIRKAIEQTPTADVVEVVRCKDCKWWENGKDYEPYCNHCESTFVDTTENDFCSYGERKEQE